MLKTNSTSQLQNAPTDAIVQDIVTKLQNSGNITAAQILQTAMNLLMVAERNMHLQNNTEDKGNGFF